MQIFCHAWARQVAASAIALSLLAIPATPVTACSFTTQEGAMAHVENTRRAKARAPIVVEGFVRQTGKRFPSAWAELIARRHFKGSKRRAYPIYYLPTTCSPPFPMSAATQQKVFLERSEKGFWILGSDPLD